jgi:hypothetical protein
MATMLVGPAIARSEAADSPAVNIARGHSYTLTPAPNYGLTTDPDDDRQLTDGAYTNWNPIWTQVSTVGWSNASHVTIVIDLLSVQPISGLSYSTAAGKAGVQWPRSIFALVSDDGARFYPVGDLAHLAPGASGPPVSGYAAFRYTTSGLAVHGRYVALVVDAVGPYTFCDEVEVFGGDAASVSAPLLGEPTNDLQQYFLSAHEQVSIESRLTTDLAAARSAVAAPGVDPALRAQLTSELDEVSAAISAGPMPIAGDFTTALPLNDLHARIFAVQGVVSQAGGLPALSAWAVNPWDFVRPIDKPPAAGALDGVSIATMNGETRSGAVSLSNSTGSAMRVALHVGGLFEAGAPEVRLFEAVWTDTRELVPVADALLPLEDSTSAIDLPAGMTRQIWVQVSPQGRAPGVYHGYLDVTSGDGLSARVPVDVRVLGGRFPDRPTLHVGGWDYTDATNILGLTAGNRTPLIAELRSLGVDTTWATTLVLPQGTFDALGQMIGTPDTSRFDAWVGQWPGAARYAVFVNAPDRIGDVSVTDATRFAAAVGHWISFWVAHASAIGVQPSQLLLLLVDEPHSDAQDNRIVTWASAIRAADPRVILFEDPTYPDPAASTPKLLDASDVLALERSLMIQQGAPFVDFYRQRHSQGQALAVYGASGPARLLDPYTYYRLQPWVCADLGATSSFFWSFSDDAGGRSWNEYAATAAPYSPFLLSNGGVTISKHSEAIREGIEDFEYLTMLADRTATLGQNEPTHAGMPEAIILLQQAVSTVLETPGTDDLQWLSDKDRSAADRMRLTIADALDRLNAKTILPTSTRAAVSDNPSVFGQPVTLTATVNGVATESGAPTGTVQFADNGVVMADQVALGNGVAVFSTALLKGLPAGDHTITASYGGDESHEASSASLELTILKATPAITWQTPPTIAYGTALDSTLFNAVADTPGTFAYSPAAGTIPPAGPLELSATFVPADAVSYADATATVSLAVLPATPALALTGGRFTYDGTAHSPIASAIGIDAALVGGSFVLTYTPGGASPPVNAGTYSVALDFTSSDPNYANAASVWSIVVEPAQPVVTVTTGTFTYDGGPHGARAIVTGIGGAPVAGATSFTYAPGDSSSPVSAGVYSATAGFVSADPNYANGIGVGSLVIEPAPAIVTVTGGTFVRDGAAHGATALVTGISGGSVPGSVVLTYLPGGLAAPSVAGTYSVRAAFTSADPNYTSGVGAGSITISPAPVVATLTYPASGANNADLSLPLQWTTVFEAQAYYVYGGSTPGAKDLINTGEISQTSYLVANVPSGQTIYLRLWTKVAGIWGFTDSLFSAAPIVASLVSPADGATGVDLSQPLQWTEVPKAQTYYVWGGSTPGGKDLINSGGVSQTAYRLANPPVSGHTIYLRLWTEVAGIWRYSESTFTPNVLAASLTYPANGATGVEASSLLQWTTVPSAQTYYVYVGSTVGARDLVNTGGIAQTSYRAVSLPAGQTVFVRLWTEVGGIWRYTDTTFTTAVP